MKVKSILVATAMMGMFPAMGNTQAATQELSLKNDTNFGVWVTIYRASGHEEKMSSTCVKGQSQTTIKAPSGRPFYVLAEVKYAKDQCNGSNQREIDELVKTSLLRYSMGADKKTVVQGTR